MALKNTLARQCMGSKCGATEESPIRKPFPTTRRTVLGALATVPLTSSSTLTASKPPSSASGPVSVTPEEFGAVGDGMADDASAIQRAMDALAHGQGGTVLLQPRIAYRCGSGLVLDASHVSWWGTALLDFSGWTGRYLQVTASSIGRPGEANNNYGRKGSIAGAIRLRGAGQDTASIGIDFDSPVDGTAAQLLIENVAISGCGTGIRFGNRAYNNLLLHCEIFDCSLCVDWPATADNGERNTLVGCILFNSAVAMRIAIASASFQLHGCSLDYTKQLYDVQAGSVLATSCHHESDVWEDRPIRCAGDGSFVRLDGGWMLNQAHDWKTYHLAEVGRGASVHLIGMMTHNFLMTPSDPGRVASFATGEGEFRMTETRTFDFSALPARLHAERSLLSDPDFRAPGWEDPLWRLHDATMPIVDRYGGGSDTLRLAKGAIGGETGLVATKAGGAGAPAAFVLLSIPVRPGEGVLAGFRVRRDPSHAGDDGTLLVQPSWLRIDGQDTRRVPVIVRSEPVGTATVTAPADHFVAAVTLASRTQRTAPPWATHFCMIVDLVRSPAASFVFNGLWADTI